MVKLLRYVKGWAKIFAVIAPIFMCLEVSMDLMQPKLMADIIDVGVASGNIDYVFATGGKMIVIAMIGILGGAGCSIFASMAAMNMGQELREDMFSKIQKLSFKEIDEFKTSSLITRLTNDVNQFQTMFLMAMRIVVRAPLLGIGGIIMAVNLSKGLSRIFLVIIPIMVIGVLLIMKKSFVLFSKVQKKIDKVNIVMRENILGVRVIKAFSMEKKQEEKFYKVNDELMDANIKAQNMNIILWPVVTLIMNFSVVAILWFGGHLVQTGDIEIGRIMAFINYLIQIMNSLLMVIMIALNFSRAKASADRINEVLDAKSSLEESKNPKEPNGYDIEFKNVFFRYNNEGDYVLKNINFKVQGGEKIGIIGTTGAGKSSLISLIPRLYDVCAGEILLGGVDIRDIPIKKLRKHMGVVLQESILFSGTIEENLKFGKEDITNDELENGAKDSQCYEFIMNKDGAFNGEVEQRGKNLSGGQKQRLSIGRTIIKNPKILIMDDSTSALDMATEAKVQRSVKNRMKDSTMIIIAQRISAIMDLDKIIVLDNGEISDLGTHKELLQRNDIYRSIAISQLGEEVLFNE